MEMTAFLSSGVVHEMAQLRQNEFVHRQSYGCRRARHGQHQRLADQSTAGAAKHRGSADFLIAERAEQFSIAWKFFGQERKYRLGRLITRGDTCPARHKNSIDVVARCECCHKLGQRQGIIGHNDVLNHWVSFPLQAFNNKVPTLVRVQRTGVAHCHHGTADCRRCGLTVFCGRGATIFFAHRDRQERRTCYFDSHGPGAHGYYTSTFQTIIKHTRPSEE